MPIQYLWLLPLGLIVGAFGTLIGAGGGFVLVPVLLLLYSNEKNDLINHISFSFVIFSIATIPGAIFGALSTSYVPRRVFDLTFGILMILGSVLLVLSTKRRRAALHSQLEPSRPETPKPGWTAREFADALGIRYRYAYNPWVGILLSSFIGFISSLLGVGGGFIHVPAMTRLLNFPVRVATATSQFVLAVMALTGTLVHIVNGVFVPFVS